MNSQSISWFSFLFTTAFFILVQAPTPNGSSVIAPDQFYKTCGNKFSCGNTITDIGYPFRGFSDPPYCGHPGLVLTCDGQKNTTNINIMSTKFRVLEIDEATQTMKISREDLMWGSKCPTEIANTTLDFSLFDYAAAYKNYTFLYGCQPGLKIADQSLHTSCGNNNNVWDEHYSAFVILGPSGPGIGCRDSVVVPGPPFESNGAGGNDNITDMDVGVFREGFLIRWKIGSKACSDCTATSGRCGFNPETNHTTCYCANPPYVSDTCATSNVTVQSKRPSTVGLNIKV